MKGKLSRLLLAVVTMWTLCAAVIPAEAQGRGRHPRRHHRRHHRHPHRPYRR